MLWAIDLGSTIQWSSSQSLSLVFSGKHSSFTVPAQQLSKTAFLRWPKAEREWCQHTRKILERIVMLYCPHQICGFEMCFRIWMWLCDVNVVFSLSADSLLWLQPWNPWLGAQVLHDASRRFVVQAEGWSTSQCVGLSCLIHVAICIDMLRLRWHVIAVLISWSYVSFCCRWRLERQWLPANLNSQPFYVMHFFSIAMILYRLLLWMDVIQLHSRLSHVATPARMKTQGKAFSNGRCSSMIARTWASRWNEESLMLVLCGEIFIWWFS